MMMSMSSAVRPTTAAETFYTSKNRNAWTRAWLFAEPGPVDPGSWPTGRVFGSWSDAQPERDQVCRTSSVEREPLWNPANQEEDRATNAEQQKNEEQRKEEGGRISRVPPLGSRFPGTGHELLRSAPVNTSLPVASWHVSAAMSNLQSDHLDLGRFDQGACEGETQRPLCERAPGDHRTILPRASFSLAASPSDPRMSSGAESGHTGGL